MRRDDGTPAQVGDWWWIENGVVHFARPEGPLRAAAVATDPVMDAVGCALFTTPNRLYGAQLNTEGDAI